MIVLPLGVVMTTAWLPLYPPPSLAMAGDGEAATDTAPLPTDTVPELLGTVRPRACPLTGSVDPETCHWPVEAFWFMTTSPGPAPMMEAMRSPTVTDISHQPSCQARTPRVAQVAVNSESESLVQTALEHDLHAGDPPSMPFEIRTHARYNPAASSSLNIVPILLYAQIRGDVLHNAHLGYAIAFGMIFITGLANVFYIWFRTRSERWLK